MATTPVASLPPGLLRELGEALVHRSPWLLAAVSENGELIYVSPPLVETLGRPWTRYLGSPVRQLLHPSDLGAACDSFRKVLDAGDDRVSDSVLLRVLEGDGSWRPLEVWLFPSDNLPEPAVVAVASDLTERHQLQEILARLVEFDELVTKLSAGFVNVRDDTLDPAIDHALAEIGTFADVDRSYVFLFSDDLERVSNTHEWCAPGVTPQIQDLLDLPTEQFEWWMVRLRDFENVHVPDVAQLPDSESELRAFLSGQGIQSLVAVPLIHGSRLLGFVGFDAVKRLRPWAEREIKLLRLVGDIFANAIERRRANQDLEATEEQLRQSQKMEAVGQLAGGIAHDFNNLLTAIGGFSELLADQIDPDDGRGALLAEIQEATERARALTRQLLSFSRPQVGQPEVLDVHRVILENVNMLERLIPKSIHLELDLGPEGSGVHIDRGHLEQILLNLVLNARDAIHETGTIAIHTAVLDPEHEGDASPALQPGRPCVRLAIEDDGEGIEEPLLERIFEPFFTTKEAGKGTGLGLSTVYGLVKRAGGEIRAHSRSGAGTVVEVLFPSYTGQRVTIQEPGGPEAKIPQPGGGTGVILLVEDEEPVRRFIRAVLLRAGYQVLDAGDPRQALDLMAREEPAIDLLIADVVMPGMPGIVLAERLQAGRPELNVVYISGYPGNRLEKSHGLRGEAKFLRKPFSASQLLEAVAATIPDPAP